MPEWSRRGVVAGGIAAAACASAGEDAATSSDVSSRPVTTSEPIAKSLTLMRRKPGATHEEFMRYWLDVHAPMAHGIPGMTGFVCLEILGPTRPRIDIPGAPPIEIDGISESWKLASNSPSNPNAPPEARAWYEDGPMFVGEIKGWRVQESVIMRPRRGGKGLVSFLTRKPGVTREDFEQHWINVHGPMARSVPEVEGFVLNRLERASPRADIPELAGFDEIDGVAQSWHRDQSYPGVTSAEGRAWYADGAAHIGSARGYYTQEHVIIEPR